MNNMYGAGGPYRQGGNAMPNMGYDTEHRAVGARESDLDRLQSALEKAEHPRPSPHGVPLSQTFDPSAYILNLDSPAALESLRRTSGQSNVGFPQQSQQQFHAMSPLSTISQGPQPYLTPEQQYMQQVRVYACNVSCVCSYMCIYIARV